MKIITLTMALLGAFFIAGKANALIIAPTDTAPKTGIEIQEAYAYATPLKNPAAAVFMIVHNHGVDNDRLLDVKFETAGRTELHTMTMDNDIMKMRKVDGYDVGSHKTLSLNPMGHHVMVFDRQSDWNEGDVIQAKAVFENAGVVTIPVKIVARGAKPSTQGDDVHMQHGHH